MRTSWKESPRVQSQDPFSRLEAGQEVPKVTVNEFRANQSALVSEIQLLIMDISEMKLDAYTSVFLDAESIEPIANTHDSVKEQELYRVRRDLGRLQSAVHQAYRRNWTLQKQLEEGRPRGITKLGQEG